MSDTPRPPSSRNEAGPSRNNNAGDSSGSSGGKEKPIPADNVDTKNVMDGSGGSRSQSGTPDSKTAQSQSDSKKESGSLDGPPSKGGPGDNPDSNPASTSGGKKDKPISSGNEPKGSDTKSSDPKGGNSKGKAPKGDSKQKRDKGPRGDKKSQHPETKGEQRAGKAGKAAGKEAGRAAGASVGGPAGAAVGEKVGEKVGEQLGKKLFRKIKKRVALVTALLMVLLMLIMGVVGATISMGARASGRVSQNIGSSAFLSSEPIDAMRSAVMSASSDSRLGGEIPWGILAGVSIISTELGKLSPYPEDLCDRNPDQKPLRAKPGLSVSSCKSGPDSYPIVDPPIISGSPGSGSGPYLLTPSRVPEDVNTQDISSSGSSATTWLVSEIDRVRRDLVDNEGWVLTPESSQDEIVSFWGTVLSRLPLADPTATSCPSPVLPEKTDANTVAVAIAQVWRCRLNSTVFHHYDSVGDEITQGATDAIVREALKVSYAWSSYGTSNSGIPPGCQNVVTQNSDGTSVSSVREVPGAQRAGVFPLSKELFDKYKPSATDTRCSSGANILAAVDAFLSVESKEWDERDGSDGEKIAGGWSMIPWVLGDRASIEDLYKNGPLLAFDPSVRDKACAEALGVWVDSLKNSRSLDAAAGLLLSPAPDGSPQEVADRWPDIKSSLSSGDPRLSGPCRGRTDGSIERYAAAIAYDRQVVKEILHDDHSTQDDTTETPVDSSSSIPPISDTPSGDITPIDPDANQTTSTLAPPPVPSPDDISYSGIRAVMEFLARQSASDSQVDATPGVDSLILRASSSGRDFTGVPYPATPSSGRFLTVLKIARVLSGLWEQDPMFDPSAESDSIDASLQEALPSFSPGGVSVGSVPYALLDATQKAVTAVKRWYPQCTADAALLLGVAWTESRGSWTTIGPDGNMTPRMVHGGSIASPPVDNDNGVFDGDSLDDHAVGAFGSAPGTWLGWKWRKSNGSWEIFPGRESIDPLVESSWSDAGYGKGSDGNGDGISDPNNVYDAAIATIRNICAGRGSLDLVNWSEDFIQAFGVYVGGGDWDSRTLTRTCYRLPPIVAKRGNPSDDPATELVEVTRRECSEVLVRMKWEKAQEFRAMLSGASSFGASSSQGGAGVMTVPPELLNIGNGKLPPALLTPVGIGNEALYGPAASAFISMRQAAASAGVELWINGSYRSYEGQLSCARRKGTSDNNQWMIQNNEPIPPIANPNGWCAVPGRSNHGWGLAIDIGHDSYPCSQGTACWLWMIDNAQKYGWCDTGGGPREPWHWQYIGSGKCSGLFGSKPPS